VRWIFNKAFRLQVVNRLNRNSSNKKGTHLGANKRLMGLNTQSKNKERIGIQKNNFNHYHHMKSKKQAHLPKQGAVVAQLPGRSPMAGRDMGRHETG